MGDTVRYSDCVTIRCSPAVLALVDRAAVARGCKPSEWHRQAVLTALRLDGFDLAATLAPNNETAEAAP